MIEIPVSWFIILKYCRIISSAEDHTIIITLYCLVYWNAVIVGNSASRLKHEKIDCPIFLLITTAVIIFFPRCCVQLLPWPNPHSALPLELEETSRCLILSGTFIYDGGVHCGVNIFNSNSLAISNPAFIPIIWLSILNDNKTLIVSSHMFQCCPVNYNLVVSS